MNAFIKYIGAAIVCAAATISSAYAQSNGDFPRLERVGDVIDTNERAYFGLFPHMQHFNSAHIIEGGFVVRIVVNLGLAGSERDTTLSLAPEMLTEVNRYLQNYEALFRDDSLAESFNWAALRDLVYPAPPIRREGIEVCITPMRGPVVCGVLVWASEEGMVVAPDVESIDWRAPGLVCTAFAPADLAHIRRKRGIVGVIAGDVDIEISGNDTVFREDAAPWLRDHSLLGDHMPPEIAALILAISHTGATREPASLSAREIRSRVERGLFSLSLSAGSLNAGAGEAQLQPFGEEWQHVSIGEFPAWSYSIQAGIRVLGFMRVMGRYMAAPMPPASSDHDEERAGGHVIAAMLDVLALRRSGYMLKPVDHIEVSAGAGIAWYALERQLRLVTQYDGDYSIVKSETYQLTAPLVHGAVAYYLTFGVAIRADVSFTFIPRMDVPKTELPSSGGTGFILKTLGAHQLQFPPLETQLGLLFEF